MDVEQAGPGFVDGPNDVGAGANGVADIYAAADAWVQTFYSFQDIERRVPQLIFRPVIVDGEFDRVFADEFFDSG